jgi:hypothetical protein
MCWKNMICDPWNLPVAARRTRIIPGSSPPITASKASRQPQHHKPAKLPSLHVRPARSQTAKEDEVDGVLYDAWSVLVRSYYLLYKIFVVLVFTIQRTACCTWKYISSTLHLDCLQIAKRKSITQLSLHVRQLMCKPSIWLFPWTWLS